MKKAVKVLCLFLVMVMVMSPLALANGFDDYTNLTTPDGVEPVKNLLSEAAGLVQMVGYGIAVIMIIWLGVNYIIASPAKKAELKGKLWSMAIGVILIVGGVTILKIVADIATSATNI